MTISINEIGAKIMHEYGIANQMKHCSSEIYELAQAITEYEILKKEGYDSTRLKPYKEHIVEEFADCIFMLTQIKDYFEITEEEIIPIEIFKGNREMERIKNGKSNN